MDPLLKKQIRRFRRNRRAYFSFILLGTAFLLSLFSEAICNNKPFVLRYGGQWFFPLFKYYPASTFGDTVRTDADYKALASTESFRASRGWAIFPPIPFGPNETVQTSSPPPTGPTHSNWLGTDDRGRDLATRLIYGFRNSMLFALVSCFLIVALAYTFGAAQAFFGGRVDFYGQRFSEIWNALPVLYVIIFLVSVFPPNLTLLTLAWVAFSWIQLASYIRAEVLRVKKMEYVVAARALGSGSLRILFRHILPNSLTPILTFSPFIISASVGSLAALDYLGLGLPPPTSSWGELLKQGKENLSSWWPASFPFLSLFLTLLLLNFIGEGLRSALDARE
jgi:microcin C transport system permease protein